MTYEEVFKDWDYLWSISAADDMTGAYVDQEDLDRLLRNPTKKVAKECMLSQIYYWFQKGPDRNDVPESYSELIDDYPRVETIREKYGAEVGYWG